MTDSPTTNQKLAALRTSAEKHLAFYGHNRVGYGVDAEYLLAIVECAEALHAMMDAESPEGAYLLEETESEQAAWTKAAAAIAKLESL